MGGRSSVIFPAGARTPSEGRNVLLGEFEQRLDDKNRVTIPARLRAHFEAGVFVNRGIDQCLQVFDPKGWNAYVTAETTRLDLFTREGRQMQRFLFAAVETEIDRQGRVALPARMLERAAIERDIVVAGTGDRLEIWNRDAWRREFDEFEGSVDVAAERLARESHR